MSTNLAYGGDAAGDDLAQVDLGALQQLLGEDVAGVLDDVRQRVTDRLHRLHLRILGDADFQAGRLSTSFMDRYLNEQKKPGDGRLAEAV